MRQGLTNRVYSDFVRVVYEGRPQFFADSVAVDKIAQGRVWAGTDAKEINLIDEFGNLYDAIDAAKAAADLQDEYRLNLLPATPSPMEEILKSMGQTYFQEMNPLHQEMAELKKLERMMPKNGIFMLMNFDAGIE
jgi:protease-4